MLMLAHRTVLTHSTTTTVSYRLTLTEAFGPEDGPQRSDVSMPDASAVAPFGRAFHTDPATLAEVNSEFRAPKRRVVTKK